MPDPERLGKYEIRGVLGRGAMGIVYRGFDPHIEREVAIKTIRKDTVDADLAVQYLARFRNEAKAAGRLHHPNIVGVFEYGEDDDVAYIAMEFVTGTGLREYLNQRTSFDFAELVALLSQLLQALDYAHARGVVHRDIKPANLIVTAQGVLKVADFGIARIDTSNLTTAGMVIGTPSYMSPEQCRGLETDARSDLFSVGVVMYELLAGQKPFTGNLESVAYRICHEDPPPPSRLSSLDLPPAVDGLVARALAKDPAARFPDARSFHDALRGVAQMSVPVDNGLGTTMVSIGTLLLQRPAPAWDDETLRTAEHELARALGPLAKMIVRRAATQTSDRAELCMVLSDSIADPDARRRFVDAFNRGATGSSARPGSGTQAARGTTPGATSARPADRTAGASGARGTGTGTGSQTSPLEQAYVDQVAGRLAVYLGPIAGIVARKAARETSARRDFVLQVADSLGTQERAAFLREMGFGGE